MLFQLKAATPLKGTKKQLAYAFIIASQNDKSQVCLDETDRKSVV